MLKVSWHNGVSGWICFPSLAEVLDMFDDALKDFGKDPTALKAIENLRKGIKGVSKYQESYFRCEVEMRNERVSTLNYIRTTSACMFPECTISNNPQVKELLDASTAMVQFVDYGNKERKKVGEIFQSNPQVFRNHLTSTSFPFSLLSDQPIDKFAPLYF